MLHGAAMETGRWDGVTEDGQEVHKPWDIRDFRVPRGA